MGFRLKLANWAALRTEVNAQMSSHRPSWGAFSGVSFYPGARKSAPMVVAAPPVVQHDTVTVRERVVDTLVRVDTMRMNTRTQVTTSDTVTRTVKGQDVILVLRDANFDLGKSVLRATGSRHARLARAAAQRAGGSLGEHHDHGLHGQHWKRRVQSEARHGARDERAEVISSRREWLRRA